MKILPKDKKKYILADKKDFIILNKIYKLEKKLLSRDDRKLVKFIRTQLERDWRTPIIKLLDQLLKKY
ncbi:MAG: hypothetical protein A3J62_01440 [Candidatus Buchananbacteria bacterium RIFCSPHIGHO2_02_FULL_38_8]|uniref:Uncharacterized protein n=2 Tax=Candidatus Buchananiibacteriota TaxID=1817903 RepID=A0A1G1Y306_9BACT|nr:MAG: hypothetical protein A2731_04320 [Candidatus Buchananbacteria bacterium RIFCSPHIGHO2_01_FULL_39_8]OGY47845.1 MAG: hypothetical protein A3J62_01440 [Candidatus Buchananbacteria bacterium RIFCSPHIGHO2_02_FULL_38_8]